MDYSLLAKDIGTTGKKRLRRLTFFILGTIIIAIIAIVYGLYQSGELNKNKWTIYSNLATWKFLGIGLWNTIQVATMDFIFSMGVGAIIASGQLSSYRPLRWLSIAYVETFRAIPTLLMILFCFFGLPMLGINTNPFWSIVLGSGLYNSAVLSNIFRSGIQTIDKGQYEAAYSLGVEHADVMQRIIWPQALRRMRPAIIAQCVVLFKDSSLGFVIGYEEVLRRSQEIGTFTSSSLQPYLVGGCIYIVVIYLLRKLSGDSQASQRT